MPLAEPMGGLRAVGTAAGVCEADISLKGQCAPPGPSLALPAEVVKVRDGMVGIPRWKQSHRGYLLLPKAMLGNSYYGLNPPGE